MKESFTKIPLIRDENSKQVFFDIDKIESRSFIEEVLDLDKNTDFIFKYFGLCKDSNLFYLVLEVFDKDSYSKEAAYRFTLHELNEDFFIKNVELLDEYESISCDFHVLD